MRKLLLIIMVLPLGFGQQPRAWDEGPPSSWGSLMDGWQLALMAEKQSVFMDEPLWVSLYVRNGTSARSQVAVQSSEWMKAEFNIRRVEGGPLVPMRPPKDHFDKLFRSGGSQSNHQLDPGKTFPVGRMNVRTLYEMGPGTYRIQALWGDPKRDRSKPKNVSSNEITVSIIAR